jgi:hypothetical protein
MKKYIFTESQIKKIIDNQISEQTEERIAINAGSEEFLKIKKIQGKDLTDRIKKYQMSIGCPTTGHMMDCIDIMFEKHRKDFDLWKSLIQKNTSIIDKAANWLSKKFSSLMGDKPDPKSIY